MRLRRLGPRCSAQCRRLPVPEPRSPRRPPSRTQDAALAAPTIAALEQALAAAREVQVQGPKVARAEAALEALHREHAAELQLEETVGARDAALLRVALAAAAAANVPASNAVRLQAEGLLAAQLAQTAAELLRLGSLPRAAWDARLQARAALGTPEAALSLQLLRPQKNHPLCAPIVAPCRAPHVSYEARGTPPVHVHADITRLGAPALGARLQPCAPGLPPCAPGLQPAATLCTRAATIECVPQATLLEQEKAAAQLNVALQQNDEGALAAALGLASRTGRRLHTPPALSEPSLSPL